LSKDVRKKIEVAKKKENKREKNVWALI